MVFARPLTILFLLPICELRWVTPNRLTALAIIVKLSAVGLLFGFRVRSIDILAAVLLNLGLVLDNMDGTLARYRKSGTLFGFYFDKASDAVTLVLLFCALAFRAYVDSHCLQDLVVPLLGVCGVFVSGYVKWVADRVLTDLQLKRLSSDPEALAKWAAAHVVHDDSQAPPKRTAIDWLRFFGWALVSILLINEVDLFFWSGLALVTCQHWIFTRVISGLCALGAIVVPLGFAVKLYRLDRNAGGST
jgi:phosphatidylglycerophosphate synthase